jgi:hypothetical protein
VHRIKILALLFLALCLLEPAAACTIFFAAWGGRVLFGNNEDWNNPRTRMWFVPRQGSRYGVVYFGFDDNYPQGGMNEQGLCFDGAALPAPEPAAHPGKKKANPWIVDRMMRGCATVAEALALLDRYDLTSLERAQLLLADRSGASAIVERNHVIQRTGDYQIATNFRQSRIPPETASCPRYQAANRELARPGPLSVDRFRSILEATHQEGPSSTLYSTVYDLHSGDIYLYLAHDFSRSVKINLQDQLKKGKQRIELRTLFVRESAVRS